MVELPELLALPLCVLLTGCSTTPTVEPAPLQAEPAPAAEVAEPDPKTDPDPGPTCLPESFEPAPPGPPSLAAPPEAGTCWSVPKRAAKAAKAGLREDWFIANDNATLAIDFGCDRLGPIRELTVQFGSGHGGSLELGRLRRLDDGDWELLLLRESSYHPQPERRGVFRAQIEAKRVNAALESSRAASLLEAEEVVPKGRLGGGGMTMSSADFHAFVRFVDEADRARHVAFTGYRGSRNQATWIPAARASAPFEALIWALVDEDALTKVEPDDDSRAFFMTRFAEAEAERYYADEGIGGWWVHERLLGMAGEHASLDLLPSLGARLCTSPKGGEGRRRGAALGSMFALLGLRDPPIDEQGFIRDSEATRWAEACAIDCP